MEKRSIFKVVNGLTSALLIAPIISSGSLAMAQETEDDNSEEDSPRIVYENDFSEESYSDGVIGTIGGAELEWFDDVEINGETKTGVWVRNRAVNYDSLEIPFDALDIDVTDGTDYSIQVLGFIAEDEEIPEGATINLETAEGYTWLRNLPAEPGQFELTAHYNSDNAEEDDHSFRIKTNNEGSEMEFAVTNILITSEETAETEPGEDEPVEEEPVDESDDDSDEEASDEESELDVLYHATFEEDSEGTVGAGATVTHDNGAMQVTNRSENWHGLDIPFVVSGMEFGYTYDITIRGNVDDGVDVPEGARARLQVPEEDYPLLAEANFVSGEEFILTDTFTLSNEAYTRLRVQSNENGETVDFNVTEVLIEWDPNQTPIEAEEPDPDLPPANEFELIDFENGELNGFEPRDGNEELVVSTEANAIPEGGNYSLHVSNRQRTHQGPVLEVTDYITPGETYEISVWVKNDSDAAADIILSSQIGSASPSYSNIVSENVSPSDDWVLLQGTERYTSIADGYVNIYVESANSELEFYIDGVDFQNIESEALDPDFSLPSIAEVYDNHFDIGNIISMTDLVEPRLALLNHHHNLLTAENAMKPESLVNEEEEFTFDGTNTLVEAVFNEGFDLHGHVLVWHSQSPAWHHTDEDGKPLSRDAALNNMYTHIEEVMRNFGPEVRSWDVVNEALDGDWQNPEDWESNLRNTGFKQAIGSDYVYLAFEHARKIADELGRPDMVLYYNDYNDHIQPKAQTMYHMIKDINERWAEENPNDGRQLISGVGMQGHYNININPENVKESIERFEQLGIDIGITELDVTTVTSNEYVEEEHIRQGQIYARLFQIFREHSDSIDRVTFWGLDDSSSWRSDRYPLLFDSQLRAKLAYEAVIDPEGFLEEYPLDESESNHTYAFYGTPEIGTDGIDDMWSEATVINMNQMQQAHEVAASGHGRVLWDDDNLYVLIEVNDSNLDSSAVDAHEQDSVEVFVNETGDYSSSYFEGVGQYRVNYENTATFNPGTYSEGFESHATLTDSGYRVEMAIPWKEVNPTAWHTIGFDMQVNDAINGSRHGVVAWNDESGQGWTDPSVFGRLTLATSIEELILQLEERISHLEESLNQHESDLEELALELMELQNLLTVLQDELGEANETISELEDRVRELEERLAELEAGDEEEPGDGDNDEDPTDIIEVEEDTPTPVLPEQTVVLPDGETSIDMPADLPEGTEIIIEYLDETDLPELNVDGNYTLVIAGEVVRVTMIYPEGEEDFSGNFELTLGINEDFVGEEVFIYYYNEETGLWEQRVAEIDGDTITSTVTHFSIYGVFAQVEETQTGDIDDEEETEDDSSEEADADDDGDSEDQEEVEEETGERLPQTATATWTVGLIGLMGLATGTGVHFIRKRK